MAVVREAKLSDVLKQRSSSINGLLIYGGDPAQVAGVTESALKQLAKPEDIRRLSVAALREDPASLDDALRSLSFLGGREVILLEGLGDAQAKLVEPFVLATQPGNFLLLSAGSLSKTSVLRGSCELAERFFVVAVYEDAPSDVLAHVTTYLSGSSLTFAEGAAERFLMLCGTERSQALREAEKLALYCQGQDEISEVDVLASCGDQADFGIEAVIDQTLVGDSAAADRMYHALDEAAGKSLLPVMSAHVVRLCALRAEFDRTGNLELALRTARPPVFQGRKLLIKRQLEILNLDRLVALQLLVENAILQTRQNAQLAHATTSRLLLSLAAESRKALRK